MGDPSIVVVRSLNFSTRLNRSKLVVTKRNKSAKARIEVVLVQWGRGRQLNRARVWTPSALQTGTAQPATQPPRRSALLRSDYILSILLTSFRTIHRSARTPACILLISHQ